MTKKILVINGSLGAKNGNTSQILKWFVQDLKEAAKTLGSVIELDPLHLGDEPFDFDKSEIEKRLARADAFIFATGTYWDSWGSPLQNFLERTTSLEGSSVWLGKPVAVLVTMHSVGGKSVLGRLQAVLNTFGCSIPPMTGFVYSFVNHLALASEGEDLTESENSHRDDLWSPEDLSVVAHNLCVAMAKKPGQFTPWRSWNFDVEDAGRRWL